MRSRRKRKRDYATGTVTVTVTATAMAMASWRMCVSVWVGGHLRWCRCFNWRPLRHAGRDMVTLSLLSLLSLFAALSPLSPRWSFFFCSSVCSVPGRIYYPNELSSVYMERLQFRLLAFTFLSDFLLFVLFFYVFFRFLCVAVLLLFCWLLPTWLCCYWCFVLILVYLSSSVCCRVFMAHLMAIFISLK